MRRLLLASLFISSSAIAQTSDPTSRIKADDMRQGSIVLAGVLLRAANADKALPRPPLPTRPVVTDPFAYSADDD